MRNMKRLMGCVLVGLLLAACSSKVYVLRSEGANMAKYRTFRWVDTKAAANSTEMRQSVFAEISIRNAVHAALEQAGWKAAADGAEVLIGYDILVERTMEQQQNPVNTQPFARLYYNPYLQHWGRIYYPAHFAGYETQTVPVKEATLTLSMMDAQTDEALWQGWTTQRISTTRLTEEEIEKAVHRILEKLEAP